MYADLMTPARVGKVLCSLVCLAIAGNLAHSKIWYGGGLHQAYHGGGYDLGVLSVSAVTLVTALILLLTARPTSNITFGRSILRVILNAINWWLLLSAWVWLASIVHQLRTNSYYENYRGKKRIETLFGFMLLGWLCSCLTLVGSIRNAWNARRKTRGLATAPTAQV